MFCLQYEPRLDMGTSTIYLKLLAGIDLAAFLKVWKGDIVLAAHLCFQCPVACDLFQV